MLQPWKWRRETTTQFLQSYSYLSIVKIKICMRVATGQKSDTILDSSYIGVISEQVCRAGGRDNEHGAVIGTMLMAKVDRWW